MLLHHFMNMLMIKITGNSHDIVDLPDDELTELEKQAEKVSRETLQRLLDILMAEEEEIKKSIDPRLNLEFVIVRMAYLEPVIPVDEMVSRMENLEKRLSSKNNIERRSAPPHNDLPESREKNVDEQISGDNLWVNYKNFLKKKNSLLWSKIEPGNFLGYGNRCVKIGFQQGYIFLDDITEKSQMDRLTDISKEFFRDDVTIEIESLAPGAENDNTSIDNGVNKNISNIKNEALNHPLVQKVMDVFEGAELQEVISRVKD
jgi:DNA polymerase-3 subunit gamma/tau